MCQPGRSSGRRHRVWRAGGALRGIAGWLGAHPVPRGGRSIVQRRVLRAERRTGARHGVASGRGRTAAGIRQRRRAYCGAVSQSSLLVAGDGTERRPCERLAAELDLGARMHFTGFRPDVRNIIAACDVIALTVSSKHALTPPSKLSPWANLSSVSLRAGCPRSCVTARPDCSPRPLPAREMVANAAALLNDPGLRSVMSATCLHDVRRFSLERHVDALLHHYEDVSEGRA